MSLYRKRHRVGRQPVWMPASTYYFLASAIAIGTFFLIWAILNDAHEESPWIPAGLVASGLLIAAGAVREVVLRGIRDRRIIEQRRLDRALLAAPITRSQPNPDKLTLERNALLLNEIQRMSDAAKVLSSIPASHREVYELCEEYIDLVDRELPHVAIGSPRLRPLTKGREYAVRFHRYHMLRWAEGETRSLVQSAASETDVSRKLERASQVLAALETATSHYPNELKLLESGSAVRDLMASLRTKVLIDRAKNAKLLGNDKDCRSLIAEAAMVINEYKGASGPSNPVLDALADEIRDLQDDAEGETPEHRF